MKHLFQGQKGNSSNEQGKEAMKTVAPCRLCKAQESRYPSVMALFYDGRIVQTALVAANQITHLRQNGYVLLDLPPVDFYSDYYTMPIGLVDPDEISPEEANRVTEERE